MADLKVIAKKIKGQQALACELYATGNMDAMYLAGLVANGAQMTAKQLNEWAESAEALQIIAEYTVPSVAVENRKLVTWRCAGSSQRMNRWHAAVGARMRESSAPRRTTFWISRKSSSFSGRWSRKSTAHKTAFVTP